MTDQMNINNLEKELDTLFTQAPLSDAFVNSLNFQLKTKMEKLSIKRPRPFYLRPVWITLCCLLIALMAVTFIVGPEKVYAEMRRLLGYIPGMGLVDSSAPIRVLAEPVEQTRDGITITINDATLTGDRTHIDILVFGVPRSAYPNNEAVPGCLEMEYLLLPDGTRLERSNDFPAVPADMDEATLVIPCISNTLPGSVPGDWRLPLKFVAAPPDLTVMPVVEITPVETITAAPTTLVTEIPLDQSVSVTRVIETDQGYILVGKFTPSTQSGEWVQTTGMPVITDAKGILIPYQIAVDVLNNLGSDEGDWAYEFDAAGVIFPISITYSGVIISQPDPNAVVELPFDFGESIMQGQEWQPNLKFTLAGYSIELARISADSQSGYSFRFLVDPKVYSLGVQIKGVTPNGGGGGGGGGLTEGKFNSSLAFAELPTGQQILIFSNLTVIGEPATWQGTWMPETPRTDLPAEAVLPEGTCAKATTLRSLQQLPATISGKALVYERTEGDSWGLVLYNLDGSHRTVVDSSANWGALSYDGTKITHPYTTESGFDVFDITTRQHTRQSNISGYNPVWSNDGTRIAYVDGAADGVSILDLASGSQTQVSSLGFETVIGWLPDNSRLIIAAMFSGGAARQIRSVDPQTGEYEDLFVMEDASVKALIAALSPDGQWIAYRDRDNSSVRLVHLDGSNDHVLLDTPSTATSGLAWSADGWLGISLIQNDDEVQKVILINPDTCEKYEIPQVTGTLEGLFVY